MGPTASGKSSLALRLAARLAGDLTCEIVSVDSAQVYRGMDIGTAKPTAAERARVRHHLLDLRDPADSYSAGAFCRDAVAAIQQITTASHVPLLVGGTMLYFQALQQGLAALPEADSATRAELDARAAESGWPALHAELAQRDPATAARLHPTDAQRIQRALEVYALTGVPLSELQSVTVPAAAIEFLNIGLVPGDRSRLHAGIEARLEGMLAAGLLGEIEALLERPGVSAATPALRAVGYRQLLPLVGGTDDAQLRAQALADAATATRRLAKRQLTWLRSWPALQTLDCFSAGLDDEVERCVRGWLATAA